MNALPLAILLASAPAPVLADIGPEPTMEEFAAAAEAALARKLRKPEKVAFSWPYRLMAGPAGYWTCGRAGSVKAMKRGRPEVWVSAVVAHGRAVDAQWSSHHGMLEYLCKKEIRKGSLIAR